MGRYVIRRLIGALLVVLAVSVVTFAVFQITPILTGSRDSVAYLYVGRVADPQQVEAVAHKLGIDRPYAEQYLTYMKGIVTGREFTNGSGTDHCDAPCFGYSYRLHSDVTDLLKDRFGDFVAGDRAAVIWLLLGVSIGVLGVAARLGVRPRGHGLRTDGRVAAGPLHGSPALLGFSYGMPLPFLPNVHWVPFRGSRLWAQNLLLPWICCAAVRCPVREADQGEHAGDVSEDYVRTARQRACRGGMWWSSTGCGRH
jgi:peptide/nickel transport system permease protein